MKLNLFMEAMEAIAPVSLALSYDNVGLLIGPDHDEIHSVLVALDLTVDTASEAALIGADLVLTHHPIMFQPVHRILPDDPETAAAYILIRNGIGHFAAHTNLDAAPEGINDCLCDLIGLRNVSIAGPDNVVRIGSLPETRKLGDLARSLSALLGGGMSIVGGADKLVRKGAICSGSGNGLFQTVSASGADFLLTGEIKHSEAVLYRNADIGVILGGHYETETVILPRLISRLQEKCIDVKFSLTRSEISPFSRQEDWSHD